jgi:predicted DNA-binding antitoxin AbrB/MazE fold protein
MITIQAIYTNGVLRPLEALALEEGQIVEVTVASSTPATFPQANDDVTQNLKAATSLAEWVAATELLPGDDGATTSSGR